MPEHCILQESAGKIGNEELASPIPAHVTFMLVARIP
jgi:hypothetical protein